MTSDPAIKQLAGGGVEVDDLGAVRGEAVLSTASQIAGGDPIATHEALVHAVVLHAQTWSDGHAATDMWLENAIGALDVARTSDVERAAEVRDALTPQHRADVRAAIADLGSGSRGTRPYDKTIRDILLTIITEKST